MNNNIKKICFISIFSYPLFNNDCDLNFGGSEVQISLLSKELALDKRYGVNLVVADTGQKKVEKIDNVNIFKAYKRGLGLLNCLKAPFILYRVLKRINPDVVICRATGVEVGISSFYCRKNKKKFIYSIASNKDLGIIRFLDIRGLLFKYGLYNADCLVAQTNYQLDQIKKNNKLNKKNSILIKNSFNIKTSSDIVNKNNDILWVGRAIDSKCPGLFLKLAKEIPDLNFTMIIPRENNDLYKCILKTGRDIKNLNILGKIKFSEIQKYFNNSRLFINTSTQEGFPNTFLQACLADTPIISLNIDPDNFINKYNCGIICNGDFYKMKKAIKETINDDYYIKKNTANCKKYIKEKHDIKVNINSWKKIL
jgi:glycosyltransferase involved in cell wall biosynthesis